MIKLFVHGKDFILKHCTFLNSFVLLNVFNSRFVLAAVQFRNVRNWIKFIRKPGSISTLDHLKEGMEGLGQEASFQLLAQSLLLYVIHNFFKAFIYKVLSAAIS